MNNETKTRGVLSRLFSHAPRWLAVAAVIGLASGAWAADATYTLWQEDFETSSLSPRWALTGTTSGFALSKRTLPTTYKSQFYQLYLAKSSRNNVTGTATLNCDFCEHEKYVFEFDMFSQVAYNNSCKFIVNGELDDGTSVVIAQILTADSNQGTGQAKTIATIYDSAGTTKLGTLPIEGRTQFNNPTPEISNTSSLWYRIVLAADSSAESEEQGIYLSVLNRNGDIYVSKRKTSDFAKLTSLSVEVITSSAGGTVQAVDNISYKIVAPDNAPAAPTISSVAEGTGKRVTISADSGTIFYRDPETGADVEYTDSFLINSSTTILAWVVGNNMRSDYASSRIPAGEKLTTPTYRRLGNKYIYVDAPQSTVETIPTPTIKCKVVGADDVQTIANATTGYFEVDANLDSEDVEIWAECVGFSSSDKATYTSKLSQSFKAAYGISYEMDYVAFFANKSNHSVSWADKDSISHTHVALDGESNLPGGETYYGIVSSGENMYDPIWYCNSTYSSGGPRWEYNSYGIQQNNNKLNSDSVWPDILFADMKSGDYIYVSCEDQPSAYQNLTYQDSMSGNGEFIYQVGSDGDCRLGFVRYWNGKNKGNMSVISDIRIYRPAAASVDGVGYVTIASAAGAASAGDTISIVGDYTSGSLSFNGAFAGKTVEFGKMLAPTEYVWVGTPNAEYDSSYVTWKSVDGTTSYGINQQNDAGDIRLADGASQKVRLNIESGYYHGGNDIIMSEKANASTHLTMNGGRLESRYWTKICEGANSTAEVTINGGQLFVGSDGTTEDGTSRARFGVGDSSEVKFTQKGGTVKANEFYIGEGSESTTTLTINDGTFAAHGQIWLGAGANSVNKTYVKGGTLSSGSWFCVGRGAGCDTYLEVDGGTVSTTATLTIGTCGDTSSKSEMVVKSGAVSANNLYVGEFDNATLTISGGFVTASGEVKMAVEAPDETRTWNTEGFCASEKATLNLDGGTLTTWKIAKGSGTGTTVVNFNGGTLKARGEQNVLIDSNLSSVKITGAKGMIIDSDYAVSIPASVTKGDGDFTPTLTKKGTGTLWVQSLPAGTKVSVEAGSGSVTVPQSSGAVAAAGTLRTADGDNYVFKVGSTMDPGATSATTYDDQTTAEAAATAVTVAVPTAVAEALTTTEQQAAYKAMFEAKAVKTSTGVWQVTVDFTATAKEAIEAQKDTIQVVDGTEPKVTVTAKPGLYYYVATGTEAGSVSASGSGKLATGDSVTLDMPLPDSGVKYYKVVASPTATL